MGTWKIQDLSANSIYVQEAIIHRRGASTDSDRRNERLTKSDLIVWKRKGKKKERTRTEHKVNYLW